MSHESSLLALLVIIVCANCAPSSIRMARSPPGSRPKPIDTLIKEAMKREPPTGRALALSKGPRLVEMDMMLTEEQWEAIHGRKTGHKVGRIALGDESYRWTGAVIYYKISNSFSTGDRNTIRVAMDEIERYTCISFVERSNQNNYVDIISQSGCWSHVGMVGGRQELSLEIGSCTFHHTIVHELLHAAGRHHEQTRPDRDQHVKILLGNIHADQRYNFDKYEWGYVRNYGVKYDYWSVMHYSRYAFSAKGGPTIETVDPAFSHVIGTVPGVSLKDIQTANLMYRCSEHCDKSKCPSKAIISQDCKCWCNTGNPSKPVIEWDGISNCLGADDKTDTCVDYNDQCQRWAGEGECKANTNYMLRNCRKSCQVCGPNAVCRDFIDQCEYWSLTGECQRNPGWMLQNCMKSCFVCQSPPSAGDCEDTSDRCAEIADKGGCEEFADAMLDRCPGSCHICQSDSLYTCRDWHIECKVWAGFGRCNNDRDYMDKHCPKACGRCSGGNFPDCKNYFESDTQCEQWAKDGECATNPGWMLFHCTQACRACGDDKVCMDRSHLCDEWEMAGFCTDENNRDQMAFYCPVSCSRCIPPNNNGNSAQCGNFDPYCPTWASEGRCDSDSNLMLPNCPRACNICGAAPVCKDWNEDCAKWGREGECEANPGWMEVHCARSCDTCPEPTEGGAGGGESCKPNPCNGGTCTENSGGGFTCSNCPDGHTGSKCEDDLCEPNPCKNMGVCEQRTGANYACKCRPGFTGTHCETDWCKPDPCRNKGRCLGTDGGYKCNCEDGYDGTNCETDLCANNVCRTGTCIRLARDIRCDCPNGVSGERCQIDNCASQPCKRGTCTATTDSYFCTCPSGVTGDNCENEDCVNYIGDIYCQNLASRGFCESASSWMLPNCGRACRICGENAGCKDYHRNCRAWSNNNECTRNPGYMLLHCRSSCDACGDGSGTNPTTAVVTTPTTARPKRDCNYYPDDWCRQFLWDCRIRADNGECSSDPGRMLVNCPIDCGICGPNPKFEDYHVLCDVWRDNGECDRSAGYMEIYCKESCSCR